MYKNFSPYVRPSVLLSVRLLFFVCLFTYISAAPLERFLLNLILSALTKICPEIPNLVKIGRYTWRPNDALFFRRH